MAIKRTVTMKNITNTIKTIVLTTLLFGNVSVFANEFEVDVDDSMVIEDSMYQVLKSEFNSNKNSLPSYDDFNKLGDPDGRNCIEVDSETPNKDLHMGIYLFEVHYSKRGPIFDKRTVQKVIAHNSPQLEQYFDKVTNEFDSYTKALESTYTINKKNYYTTEIKKRDNLLFFKRSGRVEKDSFKKYGYCYYL